MGRGGSGFGPGPAAGGLPHRRSPSKRAFTLLGLWPGPGAVAAAGNETPDAGLGRATRISFGPTRKRARAGGGGGGGGRTRGNGDQAPGQPVAPPGRATQSAMLTAPPVRRAVSTAAARTGSRLTGVTARQTRLAEPWTGVTAARLTGGRLSPAGLRLAGATSESTTLTVAARSRRRSRISRACRAREWGDTPSVS